MNARKTIARIRRWLFGRGWLFLDDGRNPPKHLSGAFDTVRDFDGFRDWVEVNGIPYLVSLDHDLHLEHIEYFFGNGGFTCPPDPGSAMFCHPTGYECSKWLLERCETEGVYPKFVIVHSANPKGSDRILNLFTAYAESNKIDMTCLKKRWGTSPRN
jgi:hypothetical protein